MKKYYPYVESFKLTNIAGDMYAATLAIPYKGTGASISYHEKCMRIYGNKYELAERCKKVIDTFVVEI